MKNIEKQLKKQAETDVPDLYDAIMSQADDRGLFNEGEAVPVGGGAVAVRRSAKPFILTACAFLLAVAVTLGIVLPLLNKKPVLPPSFSSIELSVNDFYGAGALSSVKLLADNVGTAKRAVKEDVSAVKEQVSYFNRYLTAFDAFLGEGFVSTRAEDNADTQYAQYEKRITISASGLSGSESYVMYYNEILKKDEDDEREYVLDGIMTVDGEEYLLHGERSEESDDGETEEELKIRAYTSANPDDYVEMEQEISVETGEREVEYVYRIYKDDKLVEETEVEFEEEVENGKKEVGFSLEFKKGKSKGKYKAERGDGDTMTVKYNLDDNSGRFTVTAISGEVKKYRYLFSDGTEIIL